MTYINVKRTAEVCFLACLINYLIVKCIEGDAAQEAFDLSKKAMDEHVEGTTKKQKHTIDNHHNTMLGCTLKTIKHGAAGEKAVLAVYCFIELLCDAGYITIGEDSTVALLMEWLLSKIDAESELTEKRLKNAKKDAVRWFGKLKEKGYYV